MATSGAASITQPCAEPIVPSVAALTAQAPDALDRLVVPLKTVQAVAVPDTLPGAGQCCHPFGRTTMLWGAGKEFPVSGEDFAYQIFRKRNCCATVY